MDNASLGGFTKSVLLPVTMVSLSSHSLVALHSFLTLRLISTACRIARLKNIPT